MILFPSLYQPWITSVELANLTVAVKYVITDTKRHKRDWVIGFVTVFLVVLFTSLLQNAISKSPIVFLKLAEDQVGEYDLVQQFLTVMYLTRNIGIDSQSQCWLIKLLD